VAEEATVEWLTKLHSHLERVPNTDPQLFTLWIRDTENPKSGYVGTSYTDSEPVVCEALEPSGMPPVEIDARFDLAKKHKCDRRYARNYKSAALRLSYLGACNDNRICRKILSILAVPVMPIADD
jgi:hypothetical protein